MANNVNTATGVASGAASGAAVGGPWGAVIGGAIPLVSSLFGGDNGSGEAHNQEVIAQNILNEIANAPDISKPLILQKYAQAGILTPEMEQNITAQLPPSITTDPKFKQAQMQALQQMQQRAQQGLTQGDRAALNQTQLGVQADTKSRLASIQQQMQQQGLSDSGSALAAKLSAAQGESNQMATNADQQAQIAQQARESALSSLGQFANQSQNQDFSQQSQQQAAKDQMQRFNVQNALGVQQQNVNNSNNAQAANLANAQNVSNMNVSGANQEANNQLQRQMQQATYDRQNAQIKAGAAQTMAGADYALGKDNSQAKTNQASGEGQLAQGLYGAFKAFGGQVHNYKKGGQVVALNAHEKAVVPGDSLENDNVHAMLTAGEIVVPKTLSQSKFGKHLLKIIDAHNNLKNHMNGDE